MMEVKHKSLARAVGLDVGIEDHGIFCMFGGFDYEDGGGQGFGLAINEDFIRGILNAFSAQTLQECNGKMCYVEHTMSRIYKVIPLNFDKSAKVFDIEEWKKNVKK